MKFHRGLNIQKDDKTLGEFDREFSGGHRFHEVHSIDFRRAREEWRTQGGVDSQNSFPLRIHVDVCIFTHMDTLLGTNISFSEGTFEDEFPFPKVGYVGSWRVVDF